jgi:hypothetical protein
LFKLDGSDDMRQALWLVLLGLLVVALGAPTDAAPGAPSSVITGFSPYLLGAGIREVLRADPELAAGNFPVWTKELPTQQYGRVLVAPIAGINRIARLGVQFWGGRLAVVFLKWPTPSFDAVSDWRHAAESLRKQIAVAYASELGKNHAVVSASVWTVDMADAQGNQLSAWACDRPLDITIVYLWAPYVKALEDAGTIGRPTAFPFAVDAFAY